MRGLLGTCWFRKFIQNLAGCRRDGAVTILDGAVWTSGCQREWDWPPIPSRGLTSGCQSRLLACVALLRSPLDGLAIGSRGHLDGTVTILNDFQSGSTSVSHPAAKKKVPTRPGSCGSEESRKPETQQWVSDRGNVYLSFGHKSA